jgi:hypothetical protein
MKKLIIYSIVGVIVLFLTISCNHSRTIFQENSKNWDTYGDAKWSFSNNEFVGEITDGAGFVLTRQPYKDFILELEFKPDSTINSGVFIRCKNEDINPSDCYELNIWDLHPDQDNRTGAIVARMAPLAFVETINKWNTFRIKAEKNRIQVWINETLTADTSDNALIEGYIGLQAKGTGEIKFRNFSIKTL